MAYKEVKYAPSNVYEPGKTFDDFKQQATNQYTPAYNEKIAAYKAALATKLASLEGQKTGINRTYDTQVQNQNINNRKAKNNYYNFNSGRGMSNSSMNATGLSEFDLANNRIQNQIGQYRTDDLNNVDAMKSAQEQGTADMVGQLQADLPMAILALAQELNDKYMGNLSQQDMFNKQMEFDYGKFNSGNEQYWNNYDYQTGRDKVSDEQWNKEFGLDEKYKNALINQINAGGGSGGYGGNGGNGGVPSISGTSEAAKYVAYLNDVITNGAIGTEDLNTINEMERYYANDNSANGKYMRTLIQKAKAKAVAAQQAALHNKGYKYPDPPGQGNKTSGGINLMDTGTDIATLIGNAARALFGGNKTTPTKQSGRVPAPDTEDDYLKKFPGFNSNAFRRK